MNWLLLSDIHKMLESPVARLDNIHEAQEKKLDYVFSWAVENEAKILMAGDVSHRPRGWYLLPFWVSFLKAYDVPVYAVYGQHDLYMYSGKARTATTLGILASTGLVEILGDWNYIMDNWCIKGCSIGEEVPEPTEGFKNALVIHKMIVDKKLWASQEDYIWAPDFLAEHKGYDLILCGDCHQKFLYKMDGRIICNTGCLTRYTADEYNFTHKPGFFEFSTETAKIKWHDIPHEPAEKVLTREHIEREQEVDEMLEGFIKAIQETTPGLYSKKGSEFGGISFMDNLQTLMAKEQVSEEVKNIISGVADEEK